MKTLSKTFAAAAVVVALSLVASAGPDDKSRENWKVIKREVRDNPRLETGREAKWLKVLITSGRSERETVRLSLPLSLIEAIADLASDRHIRCEDKDLDLDFREILTVLKKSGPMSLIEISDHGEKIKVWIE